MSQKNMLNQKVEVSRVEYTLLKAVCNTVKKQTALLRVLEAEENLRKGNISRVSLNTFIKSI